MRHHSLPDVVAQDSAILGETLYETSRQAGPNNSATQLGTVHFTPNTNALYPLLRLMEEKGYIVGEWDNPVTRGKRNYTITAAGADRIPQLEAMMEERLRQSDRKLAVLRSDLLGH